jgi:hypothetical protein
MHPASTHTATPEGAASLLLAALEHTWSTIRTRYPDVPGCWATLPLGL